MRRYANAILSVSLFCLLALQTSGLHLHADLGEATTDVHGLHAGPVGHEHADDIDVAFFDAGAVWSKLVDIMPGVAPPVVAVAWLLLWRQPVASTVHYVSRQSRWRPPLRAPPALS